MSGSGRRSADTRILAALVGGSTAREAADAAGVSERTVRRRLTEPDFRAQVAAGRDLLMERVLGQLLDGATEAVETLRMLHRDPDAPPTVRLGAARAMLQESARIREDVDLAQRVGALEKVMKRPPSISPLKRAQANA